MLVEGLNVVFGDEIVEVLGESRPATVLTKNLAESPFIEGSSTGTRRNRIDSAVEPIGKHPFLELQSAEGEREESGKGRTATHDEPRSEAHSDTLVRSPVPCGKVDEADETASGSSGCCRTRRGLRSGGGRMRRRGGTANVGSLDRVALVAARRPRPKDSTQNGGKDHDDRYDGGNDPPQLLLVAFPNGRGERGAVIHSGGLLAVESCGGGRGRVTDAGKTGKGSQGRGKREIEVSSRFAALPAQRDVREGMQRTCTSRS
jgi:hypothetical protein